MNSNDIRTADRKSEVKKCMFAIFKAITDWKPVL